MNCEKFSVIVYTERYTLSHVKHQRKVENSYRGMQGIEKGKLSNLYESLEL